MHACMQNSVNTVTNLVLWQHCQWQVLTVSRWSGISYSSRLSGLLVDRRCPGHTQRHVFPVRHPVINCQPEFSAPSSSHPRSFHVKTRSKAVINSPPSNRPVYDLATRWLFTTLSLIIKGTDIISQLKVPLESYLH